MQLSNTFKQFNDAETGRKVVQLTSGEGFCYPLYYFISSITKDERFLIYHKAEKGEVQLFRLEFATGESVQLTRASCYDTWWYPWCSNSGTGVLDHRSVLNIARNEVVYFDGNDVHTVNVETLHDQKIFTLSPDRAAIGQNCVTPDGKWLVYIHADRKKYESVYQEPERKYPGMRWHATGTALCAYNFESGEHRTLLYINSPIHHVIAYDNEHVVFCHQTVENAMLLTSLKGGWYTHLRTQDEQGGCVCHYVTTAKGIAYEVLKEDYSGALSGIYNPFTHQKYEFKLPDHFGYTHTGCDEEGRLWFFENSKSADNHRATFHNMYCLKEHNSQKGDEWIPLVGNWTTYGSGQKSHFHPRLTPDRNWILFTGGDPETRSNQLFLLDASDLSDTIGIPEVINR